MGHSPHICLHHRLQTQLPGLRSGGVPGDPLSQLTRMVCQIPAQLQLSPNPRRLRLHVRQRQELVQALPGGIRSLAGI